jgi:hypothetical protein
MTLTPQWWREKGIHIHRGLEGLPYLYSTAMAVAPCGISASLYISVEMPRRVPVFIRLWTMVLLLKKLQNTVLPYRGVSVHCSLCMSRVQKREKHHTAKEGKKGGRNAKFFPDTLLAARYHIIKNHYPSQKIIGATTNINTTITLHSKKLLDVPQMSQRTVADCA